MKNIQIEDLFVQFSDLLSEHFTGMLIECCIISLEAERHHSGVNLIPNAHSKNMIKSPIELNWQTQIKDKISATYKDVNRTTDNAAMCIALSIASQLKEFNYVEASKKGDGIDFWLSKTDEFDFFARLEVSGIRSATKENSIKKRLKIKLTQTSQSDSSNTPVYVSIIEFSKPEALYIKK